MKFVDNRKLRIQEILLLLCFGFGQKFEKNLYNSCFRYFKGMNCKTEVTNFFMPSKLTNYFSWPKFYSGNIQTAGNIPVCEMPYFMNLTFGLDFRYTNHNTSVLMTWLFYKDAQWKSSQISELTH